jgi:hypothetical protein
VAHEGLGGGELLALHGGEEELAALLVLGVVAFPGWLFLAALVGWMGTRHPPLVEGPSVRGADIWQAAFSLVILVLTFAPRPIVGPTLLDLALGAL